jgi:hypothetical protein
MRNKSWLENRSKIPVSFFISHSSFLIPTFLLLWSCASQSFTVVDSEVERSGYADSVKSLEKNRKALYRSGDRILYYLDKGMLEHYARQYQESSKLFQEGERAIEEAYTKSITQGISTYLVNDNMRDYGGEDYEDIYINVFNALNYYHRGELEGAMVEIRKMNNKLRHLAVKYDTAITGLQRKALEDNARIPPNPASSGARFSDSALARYLGMLFHRGAGQYDDARIDRDWLLAAFANSPSVYKNDIPESLSGEMEIPEGMARLNVIAFGGLSPIKQETVVRIPLPEFRWIKIALPEMVSRKSEIYRIELVLDDGRRFGLELLEDMDAVAKETFKARQQFIYLKTVLRATVKAASSSAMSAAAREVDGVGGLVLGLSSIAAQAYAEASEQADLRVSRYFPAKAFVGGINLPPGPYSFSIKYYNRNGKEIASIRHENINIRENALNLVQAVSLK